MDTEEVLAIAMLENYSTYLWRIEELCKVMIEDMNAMLNAKYEESGHLGANF
ncbi:MAG: hypothetical protein JRN20_03320 [Nitrososphaerota archaeon]|nr:hypothetical protein [Nitrososphaerota archaeon]